MLSSGHDQIFNYVDFLIPAIRRALCDSDSGVRTAGAQAFAELHSAIGPQAVDEIVPPLLLALEIPEQATCALDGLRQVMVAKSQIVLPFLVPRLVTPPMTVFNARALASLSSVGGPALVRDIIEGRGGGGGGGGGGV